MKPGVATKGRRDSAGRRLAGPKWDPADGQTPGEKGLLGPAFKLELVCPNFRPSFFIRSWRSASSLKPEVCPGWIIHCYP